MKETKAMPHDIQAERAALGSMIISAEAAETAQQKMSVHDFYKISHKHIFAAILKLHDGTNTVDPVMLIDHLRSDGILEKIGDGQYVRELIDSTPTAANVEYYCNIVREKSVRRHMIENAVRMQKLAYDESKTTDTILDSAESEVLEIRNAVVEDNIQSANEYLYEALKRINTAIENPEKLQGIPYGCSDLDHLTAGMHSGEMIVVAARPSVGKTTLALNMIYHACIEENRKVGFCSMEMTGRQLLTNMLCIAANKNQMGSVDGMQLRTGRNLSEGQIGDAAAKIQDMPLVIDDTAGIRITDLRAKARRMKKKHDIELFVLDYMQQLQPAERCENRAVAVSEISNGIKSIAKELDIPVLAIAQLNRASVSDKERPPRMSDLRESGTIEQDADVIMLLHQVSDEEEDTAFRDGKPRHVEIIVEKQRNGPQGICEMNFWDKHYLFESRRK